MTKITREMVARNPEAVIAVIIKGLREENKRALETDKQALKLAFDQTIADLKKMPADQIAEMLQKSKGTDGLPGKDGIGVAGKDGKTPVKGLDYWTATDIKQLAKTLMGMLKDLKPKDGEDGKTPKAGVDFPTDAEFKDKMRAAAETILAEHGEVFRKEVDSIIKGMRGELLAGPGADIMASIAGQLKEKHISAEFIARLLETLKGEKKLDYKALKNRPPEATIPLYDDKNPRAKRGGRGGGMGDWKHEAFNLTGATTSVQLTRGVAAGGTAIMVRYQGQFLAHGTEYSANANGLITLLFTPQASTVLDVTYVTG